MTPTAPGGDDTGGVVLDGSRDRRGPRRRPGGAWRLALVVAVVAVLTGLLAFAAGRRSVDTARPPAAPAAAPTSAAAPPTGSATPAPPNEAQEEELAALLAALPRRAADDPLALGRPDAKVVLVEFSDWRCPFCALWSTQTLPALQPLLDDGTLRIEYRDLPIFGEQSELAARAGRAAAAQGRFWPFYRAVFAAAPGRGHPDLPVATLKRHAQEAGVPDLDRFERDLSAPAADAAIARDVADAQRIGAPRSVPLFIVGREVLMGAQPTPDFLAAIDRQAARP